MLIVGGIGGGKIYFFFIIIEVLLKLDVELFIFDFKNVDLVDLGMVMFYVYF